MKKIYCIMMMMGLAASMIAAPVSAVEKLERGKDRIDTPAIGSGLCVHNLFQSNMYEIYTGKKTKIPNVLDTGENRELINALKADDLKRRIEEAKALLKANNSMAGNKSSD